MKRMATKNVGKRTHTNSRQHRKIEMDSSAYGIRKLSHWFNSISVNEANMKIEDNFPKIIFYMKKIWIMTDRMIYVQFWNFRGNWISLVPFAPIPAVNILCLSLNIKNSNFIW